MAISDHHHNSCSNRERNTVYHPSKPTEEEAETSKSSSTTTTTTKAQHQPRINRSVHRRWLVPNHNEYRQGGSIRTKKMINKTPCETAMANWRLYNDRIYNSDSSINDDQHQSKSPLTEKEALELHRRVFDVSYREEFNGEIFDRKKSVRYLREYLRYKSQLPKMKVDICETEILDSEHFRYTLNWQYQQTQTQQSTTDETTMSTTTTTTETHEDTKTNSTADPADAVDDMTPTTTKMKSNKIHGVVTVNPRNGKIVGSRVMTGRACMKIEQFYETHYIKLLKKEEEEKQRRSVIQGGDKHDDNADADHTESTTQYDDLEESKGNNGTKYATKKCSRYSGNSNRRKSSLFSFSSSSSSSSSSSMNGFLRFVSSALSKSKSNNR